MQDVILWYADRWYLCVNRTFWYRNCLTALENFCVESDYMLIAIKTVVYRGNTGQDVKLDFVNISNVKDETAMFPCQWISWEMTGPFSLLNVGWTCISRNWWTLTNCQERHLESFWMKAPNVLVYAKEMSMGFLDTDSTVLFHIRR